MFVNGFVNSSWSSAMSWSSAASVALALLFPQENAEAQCRNLYGKVQQVVVQPYTQAYVQQVVAVPHYQNYNVRYFLGEDLQVEALAEKLAPRLSPLLIKEMIAQGLIINGRPQEPVTPIPTTPENPNGTGVLQLRNMPTFSAKCARCHTGADPKSGISFDRGISDKSFRKFVLMFRSAKDVPKGMQAVIAGLTGAEKGAITEEVGEFYEQVPVEDLRGSVNRDKPDSLPPPKPKPDGDTNGELR